MIQTGDHQPVAGEQGLGQRAAEVKGQGGHIGAEDDLLGTGSVEKIRGGLAGGIDDFIRGPAGGKCAAMVGVILLQICCHPVQDRFAYLSAPRVIKKGCLAV